MTLYRRENDYRGRATSTALAIVAMVALLALSVSLFVEGGR